MDHRLPNKSGIETTSEILKLNSFVKIIFISADKEIKKRALEVGAFCVINKPFIFDELIACINKALINN
jgi:DNA-binding response OmpR family regulator